MLLLSEEIQLLIESARVCLLVKADNNIEIDKVKSKVNWNKLFDLAGYHSFRPIAYEATKNINIPIRNKLFKHTRDVAISNLVSSHEFVRVDTLCKKNNLNFIPYKGHVLLASIYQNKPLREIGDLDFLFHPKNAKDSLELLLKDGYVLNPNDEFSLTEKNISINEVFKAYGAYEATLAKSINGKPAMIDFHWGLHYSFLPYKINIDSLFENKTTIKVNNVDCVAPSEEAMFIMLIIHHGGRDTWMKLKFMADLLAFMEVKGNKIDWVKMLASMTEMKLKRPMLVGFFLLQKYFDYEIPVVIQAEFVKEKIDVKLTEPIIDYWENCYDILSLKGRLKYERILWSIQDEGFSRWTYIKEMFKMYKIPNPIESKRLVTFPVNYYVLNGISKVITYLWKRGLGKIIR
jgi:Uncharacterised nucleotidyltransferase